MFVGFFSRDHPSCSQPTLRPHVVLSRRVLILLSLCSFVQPCQCAPAPCVMMAVASSSVCHVADSSVLSFSLLLGIFIGSMVAALAFLLSTLLFHCRSSHLATGAAHRENTSPSGSGKRSSERGEARKICFTEFGDCFHTRSDCPGLLSRNTRLALRTRRVCLICGY